MNSPQQPPGGTPPGNYPPGQAPQAGWQQPPAGYGQPQPGQQQPAWQQQPSPQAGFQQPVSFNENPFENMTSGDQSTGSRNPYLELGNYLLDIQRTAMVGRKDKMLLIEVVVVESDVPERPPGMLCSSFIHLKNADMRGRNIAQFVAAAFGCDPMQLPKNSTHAPWTDPQLGRQGSWGEYASAIAAGNPMFVGRRIGARVIPWTTKEDEEITVTNWSPAAMMVVPKVMQPPKMQQAAPQTGVPGQQMPPGAQAWGAPPQQGGFAPPQGAPPQGGFAPPAQPMPQGPPPGNPWGQQPPPQQQAPQMPQGPAPGAPWGQQPPQQAPQGGPPQQGFAQPPGGWPGQQR